MKKLKTPIKMGAGGKTGQNPPIYTSDKKKVQAYQDSLSNYKAFPIDNNSSIIYPITQSDIGSIKGRVDANPKWKAIEKNIDYVYNHNELPIGYNLTDEPWVKLGNSGAGAPRNYAYAKPKQPYIFQQHSKENIQQLPIQGSQLPTEVSYTPSPIDIGELYRPYGHHYVAGTYGAPNAIDGQQEPAPRTQYEQGGQTKNTDMKKGAVSGHPDMFWDGKKWVSSQDGATYNNGTFFANGGPIFPLFGAGPMFANGGPTASFDVNGNSYPTPFAMTPGNGQGSGMLQDLPTRMRTGGMSMPFAMWPGPGTGTGILEEYATETMKKGGHHKGSEKKKLTPQQMQMMMASMGQQGIPQGGGAGQIMAPQGMVPQGGQAMDPSMQQQPMMKDGGSPKRPAVDNTAYAGNRYYAPVSHIPAGSTVVNPNNKYVTDIAPSLKEYQHNFGQQVTYPGDTLTNNQLQSYVNRRDQIFNPYFRDYAHQTGSSPEENFYYKLSDKDREKMSNMGRTGNYIWGPSSEEGYLPAPHQYGGMPDNDGDIDIMKSGGIHIKPSHKGRFTAYKERTGKTTEEALHSKDPHVRQMANFARNAAKWHHEMGGEVTQGGNMVNDNETYAVGGMFHPLAKYMINGGNNFVPGEPDPNYDPGITPAPSPSYSPLNTGVVPPLPDPGASAPWRQGMNDQQSQQNINYGAGSSQAYDPSTGNTDVDDSNSNQSGVQGKGAGNSGWNKFYNGAAIGYGLLGSGMAIASAYNNLADERRMAGYRRSLGTSDHIAKNNQPGSKGDWDQYGNFRPNQNTPVRPGMYYPMGSNAPITQYGGTFAMGGNYSQDGGMYHAGQEVELSDAEIARLKKMGYKIDMM